MRAGRLRHQLVIWNPTFTTSGAGTDDTWLPVGTISAGIEGISNSERLAAGQQQTSGSHRVVCRYNEISALISTKSRLYYGKRIFQVTSIVNRDFRNREFEIMVEEETG
jgi:SPP1 family predicted phage head-tail adaptor